jgi:thioredoxin-related protein
MRTGVRAAVLFALVCAPPGCEKRPEERTKPASPTSAPAAAAFHEITLADACQKATQNGKLVMIDFYTTWCRACDKIDRLTWHNKAVSEWLREKTVALKIDAEQERELARRYHVNAFPTLVFLKADGKEMDRLVGFLWPQDFLREASAIASGVDRAQWIHEELKTVGDDPVKRHQLARKLADLGKHPEALQQLLCCFDHGDELDPSYAGIRLSLLVSDIASLGEDYPPALAALRERREKAQQAVLSGSGGFKSAEELAALNRALRDDAQTLEVYDRLAQSDLPQKDAMRRAMSLDVFDTLLEARRYRDILSAFDVDEFVDSRMASYHYMLHHQDETDQRTLKMERRYAVGECGKLYEVLLGVQKNDEAAKLAERLMVFDPGAGTLTTLITFALHAGDLEPARAFVDRKLEGIPQAHRAIVQAALQSATEELPRLTLMNAYFALACGNGNPDGADALGQQVVAALSTQPMQLNDFAWRVLTDKNVKFRDLDLALRVAKAAYDASGGKEPNIIDTYARALWDNGSKSQALELQRQAVRLATETGDTRVLAQLEQNLTRYVTESTE